MGHAGWQKIGLILAVLLAPGAAPGRVNAWTSLGPDGGQSWSAIDFALPPFGAIPNALVIDPQDSNVFYTYAFGPGILRSADGGATWTEANFGSKLLRVRTLMIDAGDPGTTYAGTDGGGVLALTIVP